MVATTYSRSKEIIRKGQIMETEEKEYNVSATLIITCNIDVVAQNPKEAEKEALDYFDVSANLESDFYHNICVTDITIDDINE